MQRWPLHPRPLPDETLTSWFVRVARANGASPTTWLAATIGRYAPTLDLDTREDDALWELLGERTGHGDAAAVRALTFHDTIAALTPHAASRWMLSVDRRTLRPKHRWCPRCVATDVEPYIRRAWRMEWVVWCPRDGVRMRDACPNCGSMLIVQRVPWRAPMMSCWSCGRTLADSCARAEVVPEIVQRTAHAALPRIGAGVDASEEFGVVWCLQKWAERIGVEHWAELASAADVPTTETRARWNDDPAAQAAMSFALAWHLFRHRNLAELVERFRTEYNRATDMHCPALLAPLRRSLQTTGQQVEVAQVEAVVAARIAADLPIDMSAVALDLGVARDYITRHPSLRHAVVSAVPAAAAMHRERVRQRVTASRERLIARGERPSRAAVAREAGITREEAERWELETGVTLTMSPNERNEAQVRTAVAALRRRGARVTVMAVSREVGRGRTLLEQPRLKAIVRAESHKP